MNSQQAQDVMRASIETVEVTDARMPSAGDRLDSWKEIAAYLRRSVRCIQRWEKNEVLPIFRHRHARGATVYAYRWELDEWWHGRAGGSDDRETSLMETTCEERIRIERDLSRRNSRCVCGGRTLPATADSPTDE